MTQMSAVTPRPDWPGWASPPPQRACRLLSRGADGRVGRTVHLLFDLHAVITFTNTHTHTVMKEQTCVPTLNARSTAKDSHTKNKNATSSLLMESILRGPCCLGEYWLLSRNGQSGRLINDSSASLGFRHNNTESADWAAQQTVNSAHWSLKQHFKASKLPMLYHSLSQSGAVAEKKVLSALTGRSLSSKLTSCFIIYTPPCHLGAPKCNIAKYSFKVQSPQILRWDQI